MPQTMLGYTCALNTVWIKLVWFQCHLLCSSRVFWCPHVLPLDFFPKQCQ